MKVTICRLDSSFFINDKTIPWLIQSIDSFSKNVTAEDLAEAKLNAGVALAYYARAAYNEMGLDYDFDKSVITKEKRNQVQGMGNKNSLSSWCRIYGLLYDDEGKFELGEIAEKLLKTQKISLEEYCFANLAKQWVCVDKECKRSFLAVISELINNEQLNFLADLGQYVQPSKPKKKDSQTEEQYQQSTSYQTYSRNVELQIKLQGYFFNAIANRDFIEGVDEIQFTRFDTLKNALVLSGILEEVSDKVLQLTDDGALILDDFIKHEGRLSKYGSSDVEFHQYMSAVENGAFDLISHDNALIYKSLYPNLVKLSKDLEATEITPIIPESIPIQQIRYGAPGTGKSFETDKITKKYPSTIRTTFHPDTDYASFVGAYKPATSERNCYGLDANGNTKYLVDLATNETLKEIQVEYKFIKQAFIKAYIKAWTLFKASYKNDTVLEPQFLVIEEINRGNCAQIFGDLFQLLDRKNGFSEYPIIADEDIRKCLIADSIEDDLSFGKYGLQLSLRQRAAINRVYDEPGKPSRGIADKICNGEVLALPCNFYISATMNTSDQSLFPMDSAFKRRWSWRYEAINYKDASKFNIKLGAGDNAKYYPWDEFLLRINKKIALDLHSGAKQMGNRFVKMEGDTISEEDFINKVIFYLFTDAYKDDDSFGMYFFDKDENSEGVWLFENIFDYGNNPSYLCQNFIEHLIRDFSINEYLQAKATIV